MDGATGVLIKLAVRLAVFGVVFYFATRRNPKVVIRTRWAMPLVALTFAALNTGLYWALKPVLDLATLGALGFVMPFVANAVLLVATVKLFAWHRLPHVTAKLADGTRDPKAEPRPLFEITGMFATLWMAAILTAAHGVLWVGLDYLPSR